MGIVGKNLVALNCWDISAFAQFLLHEDRIVDVARMPVIATDYEIVVSRVLKNQRQFFVFLTIYLELPFTHDLLRIRFSISLVTNFVGLTDQIGQPRRAYFEKSEPQLRIPLM